VQDEVEREVERGDGRHRPDGEAPDDAEGAFPARLDVHGQELAADSGRLFGGEAKSDRGAVGFGLRVPHALIFGLGYVVIWEATVAALGKGPASVSIRHYAVSVFAHISNQTVQGVVEADLGPSVIILAAVALVGVVLASVLLARQDVA